MRATLTGKDKLEHQLSILQASKDGKTVEFLSIRGVWEKFRGPTDDFVCIPFHKTEFRIKPEPIEAEYWHKAKGTDRNLYLVVGSDTPESWFLKNDWVKVKMRQVTN